MDVILHVGAHRSGSTSFQAYMRQNAGLLAALDMGYWGPVRIRNGLMHGVIPNLAHGVGPLAFARAQGRISMQLDRARANGVAITLVSDENILGNMRQNISSAQLYLGAGERVARFVAAFGGRVTQIALTIRALDTYWASALSFCIPRGVQVPSGRKLAALAEQPRNWRDVITDIAAAAPDAEIIVRTFERSAARPHAILANLVQLPVPPSDGIWRNERPGLHVLQNLPLSREERARLDAGSGGTAWAPFTMVQHAALRERYADDIFWLRTGADGLASFTEDPKDVETGQTPQADFLTRGLEDDTVRRLARPG